MRPHRALAILVTAALVLGACASGSEESNGSEGEVPTPTDSSRDHMDHDMGSSGQAEFNFGEPAEAARATRTVAINMPKPLKFDPSMVDVTVGETVTFKVTNDSTTVHDFTLGDEQTQAAHEKEMQEGQAHLMDEPNSILLEPGETKELTWKFTQPGTVLFGCHQPGHYAAGMYGTINVTA